MGNQILKASEIKASVSIVDLLSRLGYRPVKKVHGEYYFHSMLRETGDEDNGPSLAVNDKKGFWYDHGKKFGGNIIEFGIKYWPGATFPEVLEKIAQACSFIADNSPVKPVYAKTREPKMPHYGIIEIKDLGHSAPIMNYLESRGVARVAEGRLKEVYYYVEDENKKRYNFFAAGWQNENGNWVVRSLSSPLSLGPNAISFLPGSVGQLSVFEGFFDYLSWLTEHPFQPDSILVLNSVSNLAAGIDKATGFNHITLYFDHDPAGRKATLDFIAAIPHASDGAHIYGGHNDYNDKIVSEQSNYQHIR
jgi:Toprim-like